MVYYRQKEGVVVLPFSDFTDMGAFEKYTKWVENKTKDKPNHVKVMMRRTNGTALAVISKIKDIPFEALTHELYFYCKDLQAEKFTRMFESQLELAAIDADKFVHGLHKFMNEVTRFIKKENLYAEFFEFIALCERLRFPLYRSEKKNALKSAVADLYQNLLLQCVEYMREPDKFDFSVVVCGVTTDGEILLCKDAFYDFDIIAHELTEYVKRTNGKNTAESVAAEFFRILKRRGHSIEELGMKEGQYSFQEFFEKIENTDKLFTHQHTSLLPYINEYTYDIVPNGMKPYDGSVLPFELLNPKDVDTDTLVEKLHRRARILPANGMHFDLSIPSFVTELTDGCLIKNVFMREIVHDDKMLMLYKATLGTDTEISGYYDTTDGYFYTVLQECPITAYYDKFKTLILYLYACAVLRDGDTLQNEFSKHFEILVPNNKKPSFPFMFPIQLKMIGHGGKLRKSYEKKSSSGKPQSKRIDDDKYVPEERTVQGFIRKVGEGRTASREAIERAEALGLYLAADETYVRPFIKTVLRLRVETEEPPKS